MSWAKSSVSPFDSGGAYFKDVTDSFKLDSIRGVSSFRGNMYESYYIKHELGSPICLMKVNQRGMALSSSAD